MRILFVASECFPLIKTGGLADVVGALPLALNKIGIDVRVLLPAYPGVMERLEQFEEVASYPDLFGGPAKLFLGRTKEGLNTLALHAAHLYGREGNPYVDRQGHDWSDNPIRFAALGAIGAVVGRLGLGEWKADLVHAHDWQAGLVAPYMKAAQAPHPPSVFSIHNIAFQGLCGVHDFHAFGLPDWFFTPSGMEYYGQCSFLKAGIVFSEHVATVSPTYARELRTSAYGMGLEGILQSRASVFSGILNGIDTGLWNPEADPFLPAPYSAQRLSGKMQCKAALQAALGLAPDPGALLFTIISRLTQQKGLDLLLSHIPELIARGGQIALLGAGEEPLERAFRNAADHFPGKVAVRIGYDEELSHLMQAGADAILVPSRFEPCGLTQLYALRYGTIPIVARTGGLADTVIDANDAGLRMGVATGVQFSPVTTEGLGFALERTFALYQERKVWRRLQARAMAHPVGWEASAASYASLYTDLLKKHAA